MAQIKGLAFWKNTISDFEHKYRMWLKSRGKKSNSSLLFLLAKMCCCSSLWNAKTLKVTVRILIGKQHCFQMPALDVFVQKKWEYCNWNTLDHSYLSTCLTFIERDGHVVSLSLYFLPLSQIFCAFTLQSTLSFIVLDATNRYVCVFLVALVVFFFLIIFCLFVCFCFRLLE